MQNARRYRSERPPWRIRARQSTWLLRVATYDTRRSTASGAYTRARPSVNGTACHRQASYATPNCTSRMAPRAAAAPQTISHCHCRHVKCATPFRAVSSGVAGCAGASRAQGGGRPRLDAAVRARSSL